MNWDMNMEKSEVWSYAHEDESEVINRVKKCNISYRVLGKSDRSAMPLGNGELCTSVWTEDNGDICFYLSRSDALTELDRTVKLGMVRLSFTPNPFMNGNYEQTLNIGDGYIIFRGKGTKIKMFVDPKADQIVLKGGFDVETTVTISYFTWRDRPLRFQSEFGYPSSVWESPDVVREEDGSILFYHRNGANIIAETASAQEVEEIIRELPDFLTDRIFGGCIVLKNGNVQEGKNLQSCTKELQLQIFTESMQGSEEDFTERLFRKRKQQDTDHVEKRCRDFWNSYWEKSYIFVENDTPAEVEMDKSVLEEAKEPQECSCQCDSPVTMAYILTKFMFKCCNGGAFPILYNGMLFNLCPGKGQHFNSKNFGIVCTAPPEEITSECNPDERSWCTEHLWQNIRHPYHTFLAQGEPEALKILFGYYRRFWEVNRYRAKKYYHAEGQHNTEMTLSFGLQSVGIYGKERNGNPLGYAENRHGGAVDISPGLELLSLMLDYYDYTDDADFFRNEIQVYAKELYRYIETRFSRRDGNKMVLEPLHSIETYWDTKNPVTVVAGLHGTIKRLLKAGHLTEPYRVYFEKYMDSIPEIYCVEEEGELLLQPAKVYDDHRHNVEIPELYACFPFGIMDQFSENYELMKRTFIKRLEKYEANQYFPIGSDTNLASYSGWQYHGIVAARLGMTEMAEDILTHNVRLKNPGTRFPAMWGPIYDGVPDTDHGANIVHLLQEMVMQIKNGKIFILPAFPEKWNVSFRLHADKDPVITAEYKNGCLKKLSVFPESERNRVIVQEKEN